MQTRKIIHLVMVVILFAGCNNSNSDNNLSRDSQTPPKDSVAASPSSSVTDNDRSFLMDAASGGMMEVELGGIAQKNARDKRVKDFGEMMVRDHSKANDELKTVANNKNVNIPTGLADHQQTMVDELKKKTGKDFDFAYMDMMVNDHQEDITKFQHEANQGHDENIRSFASKTLPVLQTHLDSAQAVYKNLKR